MEKQEGSAQNNNTYVIDSENGAELVRLLNQDKLTTHNMGGYFPPGLTFAGGERILDVACGPGSWALEVAFAYPELEVTGFDISHTTIQYARTQAMIQNLDNVRFEIMDATRPLDFPDNCFHFVNARFLVGFMSKTEWTTLMRELVRITRPGGTIRLTETDAATQTNSPAQDTLNNFFAEACYLTERSFSPSRRNFGITPMLNQFLRQAGCLHVCTQAHVIDYSVGATAHHNFFENLKVAFKLREPFVIKAGVSTEKELNTLYEQMLTEMLSDDFCGLLYYLSVWGQKPDVC